MQRIHFISLLVAVSILILVLGVVGCHRKQAAPPVSMNETQPPAAKEVTAPTLSEAQPAVNASKVSGSANMPTAPNVYCPPNSATPVAGSASVPGVCYTLQPIHFDFDKSLIKEEDRPILDQNAKILNSNPNLTVQIAGNCDERGTEDYNLALGEHRAHAALDYLKSLGVNTKQMSTISYGKERPLDSGHNEAAWAKNRRDDFDVVK